VNDFSFFFLCHELFLSLFLLLLFVFSFPFLPFLSPALFLFPLFLASLFLDAHPDQVLLSFFLTFPEEIKLDFFVCCGARDRPEGLTHARQMLYQLAILSAPQVGFLYNSNLKDIVKQWSPNVK
jgi:hypothetical protein